MGYAAYRASPLPHGKVFCSGPLSTAYRTKLAGWEEAVYRDHLLPIPRRLVLQLPPELTPRCVCDGLGQSVVSDHVFRGQILNADHVVLADDFRGHLVEHILPLVGDVLMQPCHLKPSLFPAVALLCFSGELPLEAPQFLLASCKVFVVGIFHPVGGNSKGLDTHVEANSDPSRGQRLHLHVGAAQGNEILAAWIAGDCGGQDASRDRFRDTALHFSQLRELHGSVQHLDVCADAFALVALTVVVLALEPGVSGLLPLLDTAEEVLICGIQVLQGCLQRCRIHFFQPWQFLFECRETFVLLESCGHLSVFPILFLPLGKKMVEHIPATTKIPIHLFPLRCCWIQAEFIAVFHLPTSHILLILYVLLDD